jgi:hypothetical protein
LPSPDKTPPVTMMYFGITIIEKRLKELTVFPANQSIMNKKNHA